MAALISHTQSSNSNGNLSTVLSCLTQTHLTAFVCVYIPNPAPTSLLTFTDPPLLWDATSHRLRYELSGKHTSLSPWKQETKHVDYCCLYSLFILWEDSVAVSPSPHRNGSVIADYQLKFLMPEEKQDQLRKFTLSREMVYNVLRQFLYDQESESESMYIDPISLNMFLKQ